MARISTKFFAVALLSLAGCQREPEIPVVPLQPERGTAVIDVVQQHLLDFERQLKAGDYPGCELALQKAIQANPRDPRGYRYLAQLLNAQGRRFEAQQQVLTLEMLGGMSHTESLSLIDVGGPFKLADFGHYIKEGELSLFDLGKARIIYDRGKNLQETLRLLDRLVAAFPDSAPISVFRGRILADTGDFEALSKWLETAPQDAHLFPEYWYGVGSLLTSQDRDREAVRAFAEAIRLDPTDRKSLRSLAASLDQVGNGKGALQVQQIAGTLDTIMRLSTVADAQQSLWIADQLQKLVRPWESLAWQRHAAEIQGQLAQFADELQRRRATIEAWQSKGTPDQLLDVRLKTMLGFDTHSYPLPDLKPKSLLATSTADKPSTNKLRFVDVAEAMGVKTSFVSDYPSDGYKFLLHQANGGGIAVIDLDLDGYCDLYFAQSGGDPRIANSSARNQLYRRLGAKGFIDVSVWSQTGDRSFSQGVCAADVNQDGFTDLLVANIGKDSLYLNQGDGTFREQSNWINDSSDSWTSSIAVGDLNGDGLPDLVEVNYLDDPNIYLRPCLREQHDCTPQRFRAAKNRILIGGEDGRFVPWDQLPESSILPNYGMGVVIANFDRQAGNDIFISNDGDLNAYWKSMPRDGNRYVLTECAAISGCSVGHSGYSQACMGIAAADYDRNGLLDLMVTNFYDEPVNLFLQSASQFFVDDALSRGLATPSVKMLGFGTQSADFDNDGWQDIAVLNGHIYNADYAGVPFRMPPQLFAGQPVGFTLMEAVSAGDYWQREQLGRTLTLVDLDQDGRMDMVANHLDRPVALLHNNSDSQNWLQLELVGTKSERSAVGASVVVVAGDQRWTAWRTGGDGYMGSNEPLLHIGLGSKTTLERVEVQWPSGSIQVVQNLKVNQRYLVVEDEQNACSR